MTFEALFKMICNYMLRKNHYQMTHIQSLSKMNISTEFLFHLRYSYRDYFIKKGFENLFPHQTLLSYVVDAS